MCSFIAGRPKIVAIGCDEGTVINSARLYITSSKLPMEISPIEQPLCQVLHVKHLAPSIVDQLLAYESDSRAACARRWCRGACESVAGDKRSRKAQLHSVASRRCVVICLYSGCRCRCRCRFCSSSSMKFGFGARFGRLAGCTRVAPHPSTSVPRYYI